MFTQRRLAKNAKYSSFFIVVVGGIDTTPGITEYPIHKIVLLDELRVGDAVAIRLADADHE